MFSLDLFQAVLCQSFSSVDFLTSVFVLVSLFGFPYILLPTFPLVFLRFLSDCCFLSGLWVSASPPQLFLHHISFTQGLLVNLYPPFFLVRPLTTFPVERFSFFSSTLFSKSTFEKKNPRLYFPPFSTHLPLWLSCNALLLVLLFFFPVWVAVISANAASANP